jgi:hypothetical protein
MVYAPKATKMSVEIKIVPSEAQSVPVYVPTNNWKTFIEY